MTQLREDLEVIGACAEAREWAGERTPQQAWDECQRPDWLMWWAARTATTLEQRVKVVRVACMIARTVLHLVPAGEERPRLAIEAAEAWCEKPSDKYAARAVWDRVWAGPSAWATLAACAARDASQAAWDATGVIRTPTTDADDAANVAKLHERFGKSAEEIADIYQREVSWVRAILDGKPLAEPGAPKPPRKPRTPRPDAPIKPKPKAKAVREALDAIADSTAHPKPVREFAAAFRRFLAGEVEASAL